MIRRSYYNNVNGKIRFCLERRRIILYLFLAISDTLLLYISFYILEYWHFGSFIAYDSSYISTSIIPSFILFGSYFKLYSIKAIVSSSETIKIVVYCIASAGIFHVLITFFAATSAGYSRAIFLGGMVTGWTMISICHLLAIKLFKKMHDGRFVNTLIIDAGGAPITIAGAHRLSTAPFDIDTVTSSPDDLHRFGEEIQSMERVIVSCLPRQRGKWASLLQSAGVRGEVLSTALHAMGAAGIVIEKDFTSIIMSSGPLGLRARILKRGLDLLIVIPAIIIFLPIYLTAGLAIWLEDRGPIMFTQRRTGKNNVYFTIFKFRTMGFNTADQEGCRSTEQDDSRVTGVGKVLRATSIDELPQLFNVLKGDMSIVGPRPHATGSRAGGKLFWEVSDTYWRRHALKPGLTGLAQIRGQRGATHCEGDLSNRLASDLEYLANWSPLRDLVIILRTVKVLTHPNAY